MLKGKKFDAFALRQSVSPVAQQLLCACITADMRMHNSCCACGSQLLCTNYYPVYYFLITFLETFLPLAN